MCIFRLTFWAMLGALTLAACGPNTAQQTLEADHSAAATGVADLAITASVQAARLEITLDFMGTRAAEAATQSQFLKATLNSRGTPFAALEAYQDEFEQLNRVPTLANVVLDAGRAVATLAPGEPTVPPITPMALLATDLPRPTQASVAADGRLQRPLVGTRIGADDCAMVPDAPITPNTAELYISAFADDIAPGTRLAARWFREGTPVGNVYEFVPDFAIDGACIWFFMDQNEFAFSPGAYSAVIDIDGQPAFSPVPFTIFNPDGSPPIAPTPAPGPDVDNAAEATPALAATPAVSDSLSSAALRNPIVGPAVGADDCAIAGRITPDTPELYVSARARVAAGARLTARWFREGAPVGGVYEFVPDFTIDGACIWFFMDQSEFTFSPGAYSVVIEIDGQPGFEPLEFTIAGS